MRNDELQLQKEEKIKQLITKLLQENKFSRDYILKMVAEQFFLSVVTIERIYWGEYDTNRVRREQRKQGLLPPTRRRPKLPADFIALPGDQSLNGGLPAAEWLGV